MNDICVRLSFIQNLLDQLDKYQAASEQAQTRMKQNGSNPEKVKEHILSVIQELNKQGVKLDELSERASKTVLELEKRDFHELNVGI